MIKYLRVSCFLCLVLFVGLVFYGNNKFQIRNYNTIASETYFTVREYNDFLNVYPAMAQELVDDTKVTSLEDIIKQSDVILKVKNGVYKIIKGEGIINECEVIEVYKGNNIEDIVRIYDMTYSITSDSVGYIEGSKPLVPNQEYIVFLKKAPAPNMKDSYIFSSINYGFFTINGNNIYEDQYENASIYLTDTYQYDYLGNNYEFLKVYKEISQEINEGVEKYFRN